MEASSGPGSWSIDGDEFIVLINSDEQYSIWPSAKPLPHGWNQTGPTGAKSECLAFVENHWIDMRPMSLRDQT
jgi:MbtH protein